MQWGTRKNMLRSDNEEFDVGCRFRDKDGFKVAVGFIVGIHKLDKWMSEKCVGVMVWRNMKSASGRVGEYG